MNDILDKIDFGNEAGDDVDPKELSTYFVKQRAFRDFDNPKKKIIIATAKKGVGKSALLQWLGYSLTQSDPDVIVIKARGADLVRSKFHLTNNLETPNDYIRDWMVRICGLVNRELAVRLKLALSDDKITLVECAEIEGYKSRNLVGCLMDRFKKSLVDFSPQKLSIVDEVQLLKRSHNQKLWILIDDLDATFQMTESASL